MLTNTCIAECFFILYVKCYYQWKRYVLLLVCSSRFCMSLLSNCSIINNTRYHFLLLTSSSLCSLSPLLMTPGLVAVLRLDFFKMHCLHQWVCVTSKRHTIRNIKYERFCYIKFTVMKTRKISTCSLTIFYTKPSFMKENQSVEIVSHYL